jgi:hypothetical protein
MKHLGAAAGIVIVLAGAGSAGGAAKTPPSKPAACSWGASSVTAQRVDGQWVVSPPATTGCTP